MKSSRGWRSGSDAHPAAQTLLAKAPANSLALREEKGRVRLVDER